MKLLINTATTYKGGGVQVAKSFVEECRKVPGHDYHIVLGKMLADLIDKNKFQDNFSFYEIGYRPATRVFSLKPRNTFFNKIEKKINPDVVFTTSGPAYWKPSAPHLVGYNLPHYIYRDSPFFSRISFLQRLKWDVKGSIIKYFFKKEADAYVVQTDDVNNRLKKLLAAKKVYTVSNTVSEYYQHPQESGKKLKEKKEEEFRLLTLSAWYPHKNLKVIPKVIEMFPDELRKKVRFILTLPKEIFQNEFPAKYRDCIINIGPVRPEEGPALYNECDALFLPTLLECFSASYAEAMSMGKPIITSDLGFAHSVCGKAAIYANPIDPRDIFNKIKNLVENTDFQHSLKEQGYKQLKSFNSAEDRARTYLNICKKLYEERKN